MSRTPQARQAIHALRSVLMIVILTPGSVYSIQGHPFPPRGNPLIYSLAMSWLTCLTIAFATSALFFRLNLSRFCLAPWEKEGGIYKRAGIRAFRSVLFHSPLGWINGNFHLRAGRSDCDRLLREMNSAEGVHWLNCGVSVMLGIAYLLYGYAAYGCVMLLLRIPFDLYPIMLQRWNRGRMHRLLRRPVHGI